MREMDVLGKEKERGERNGGGRGNVEIGTEEMLNLL
jgi:hypothetical protein